MPLALLALTLSAFAIGTTEFVIVGLIPIMAADLNVSLPSAGLLVSLYALGVAIGAPVLTALTGKWNRKHVLLFVMSLFVLGNLLAWQSPGYNTLVIARVLTGLAHGVFFSIGSTIATGLVAKEKAASAIAIMFTGLSVVLFSFSFTAMNPLTAVMTILIWGAFAFGNVPGLQVYVVNMAEVHTPDTVDVVSGLNIAAFNLGIAVGSWAGGLIVDNAGLLHTPWVGAVIVLLALALTRLSGWLDSRESYADSNRLCMQNV